MKKLVTPWKSWSLHEVHFHDFMMAHCSEWHGRESNPEPSRFKVCCSDNESSIELTWMGHNEIKMLFQVFSEKVYFVSLAFLLLNQTMTYSSNSFINQFSVTLSKISSPACNEFITSSCFQSKILIKVQNFAQKLASLTKNHRRCVNNHSLCLPHRHKFSMKDF